MHVNELHALTLESKVYFLLFGCYGIAIKVKGPTGTKPTHLQNRKPTVSEQYG